MNSEKITVYELRGLGDAVNYKDDETDQMCEAIKATLSERVLECGEIIEIVTKRMYPGDFKRFAE